MTTTINGITYEVDHTTEGDLFFYQPGVDVTHTIKGGYTELRDAAENEVGYSTRSMEDEDNFYFDEQVVREMVNNRIPEYIEKNFYRVVVTKE